MLQSLPELLGEEGHERVEQAQTEINARVKDVARTLLALGCTGNGVGCLHDRLDGLEVHIAQLVQPKVEARGGRLGQRKVGKAGVGLLDGNVQAVKDPRFDKRGRLELGEEWRDKR